jgi:hypothetical protein
MGNLSLILGLGTLSTLEPDLELSGLSELCLTAMVSSQVQ